MQCWYQVRGLEAGRRDQKCGAEHWPWEPLRPVPPVQHKVQAGATQSSPSLRYFPEGIILSHLDLGSGKDYVLIGIATAPS